MQVLFSFALVSLVVYLVIANHLVTRQAKGLSEMQALIEHLMVESRDQPDTDSLWHDFDDFLASHEELQIVLRDRDGSIMYEGDQLFDEAYPVNSIIFSVPAFAAGNQQGSVVLSVNRQADEELLGWLAITLVLASLMATSAVVRGVYWVVKREMKSVASLVSQIDNLTASTLESRLDGSSLPGELKPLVLQFNDLLERLSRSYTQLENFNADVAHELRTPLTTLITSSELALRQANHGPVDSAVIGSNLEELHRMSEIIRSMMFLSKAESGSRARCERVGSVCSVVREVIEYHEASLAESYLDVVVEGDARGDFDVSLLKRAVSNLLGNASQYATPTSRITVTITAPNDDYISISVINSDQTREPEHLEQIFNRFYRSDSARSGSDKNHGLGLSIVAAIAQMHGGQPFAHSDSGLTTIGFTLARQTDCRR